MSALQIDSSDDIFDPEIIYCITKIVFEPFIESITDDEQYNKMDFFIDAVPTGVRRIDGLLST